MKALLAHQHPYYLIKEEPQVSLAIARRKLPVLPPSDSWNLQRQEAKEVLWKVCQFCWDFDPVSRADMPLILSHLQTSLHPDHSPKMDVTHAEKENATDLKMRSGSGILQNDFESAIEAGEMTSAPVDGGPATSLNPRIYIYPESHMELRPPRIEVASISQSRSSTPESEIESPVELEPLRFVRTDIFEALEPLRLSANIISNESKVIASGAFADVTRALCTHPRIGKIKVAIKHLRIYTVEEIKAVGAFLQ